MATNNITLKNIHTLEHLDGKIVKYSTITAQFPDIFVQRKRNTGELIISTDTDPYYGMHHIYVGGEHIASGYGFATIKTRNDLTYVQETYNGIFNYLNNGYIYLGNAYTYMTDFTNKSYTYVLQSLLDNSYKNVNVFNTLNTFMANNVTYTLKAIDGTLYIETDYKIALFTKYTNIKDSGVYEIIKQNNNSYVLLSNDFNDYITQLTKDKTNGTTYIKFNNETIYDIPYSIIKIYFRFQRLPNILFGIKNIKTLNYTIFNNEDSTNIATDWKCNKANHTQFTKSEDFIEILKGNTSDGLTSIDLPVFKNFNASFNVTYTLEDPNIDYTSETFYFKWVNPTLIFNTKEDDNQYIEINTDNTYYNYISNCISINNNNINKLYNLSYILLDKTLNNTSYIIQNYNTDYVTNLIVPFNTSINKDKKYDFYISTDITKKANCEGGFTYKVNLPSKNNPNNKYNIYVSETQLDNSNLRLDIDIK